MSSRPPLEPLGGNSTHPQPTPTQSDQRPQAQDECPSESTDKPVMATTTTTTTSTMEVTDDHARTHSFAQPHSHASASTPIHSRYRTHQRSDSFGVMTVGRGRDMENSGPPRFQPPPPATQPPPPPHGQASRQQWDTARAQYPQYGLQGDLFCPQTLLPMTFAQPQPHLPPQSQPRSGMHPASSPFPVDAMANFRQRQQQQQSQYMQQTGHSFSPYGYSQASTPVLSYSPSGPFPRSRESVPDASAGSGPVTKIPKKIPTITPTPSSRAYRGHQSGSSKQRASETPATIKTPHHVNEHDPVEIGTPSNAKDTDTGDYASLVIPKLPGMPNPCLDDFEPNVTWPYTSPPPRYLAGCDGKEIARPEDMDEAEQAAWTKLVKDTNKFRSRNPWDYIAPDSRQQFSPKQRHFLESLWVLTCTPTPSQRERVANWMGVSSSRITIFFQNRRQGIVKAKGRDGPGVPIWQNTIDDRRFDPEDWWSNGPIRGHSMFIPGETRDCYGLIRLNPERGYVDDNGKWASYDGMIPLPPSDHMKDVPIAHAILRGELDHFSYYHQYKLGQSPNSSESGSQTPYTHIKHNHQMPPQWFETMMRDREAGIPEGRDPDTRPPRPLVLDHRGVVANLADFLPTDPPSESPRPIRSRPSTSQKRGERCPEFAMRATSPLGSGRASGKNVFWASQRAQARAYAQAQAHTAQSIATSKGTGTSSLTRHQSLPAFNQPPPKRPIYGGNAQVLPTTHSRPAIAMRPKRSFARSQSAADADSPPPKLARLVRDANGRCSVNARTSVMASLERKDVDDDKIMEVDEDEVTDVEDVENGNGQKFKRSREKRADEMAAAAEALMSFSQSSGPSGSGSQGCSRSQSRD